MNDDERDRAAHQKRRDEAREKAHWAAAAKEAQEQGVDNDVFVNNLKKLLSKVDNMSDAQLDARVKKLQGGGWFSKKRQLTRADKVRIKRAKKGRKRRWFW